MNNQQTSNNPSRSTIFSGQPKQEVAEKTVARLLDDQAAMDDWTKNIEKIRQKESDGATKHTS
ncbi:hypothetical protein ACLIIZ_06550 [Azonexus caeni]|mgnify:CR=1 FL=1|uniref:hypothetical protein n=1 Tax=Azonexus caeni TaxID=266126 RepID=UPI003A84BC8A